MSDLFSRNRQLFIKRYEHTKMIALSQIQAREIRMMELEEEADRCKTDIEAQKKVIEEADKNIKQQIEEGKKEMAEKEPTKKEVSA